MAIQITAEMRAEPASPAGCGEGREQDVEAFRKALFTLVVTGFNARAMIPVFS